MTPLLTANQTASRVMSPTAPGAGRGRAAVSHRIPDPVIAPGGPRNQWGHVVQASAPWKQEFFEWSHMEANDRIRQIREVLLGRYFSNRSELRHMAEGAGFDFVPVEFLSTGETEALVAIRPKGLGEIHVKAVRPVPSQPFFITDVKAA